MCIIMRRFSLLDLYGASFIEVNRFHRLVISILIFIGVLLIALTSHARELKLLAFGDSLIAGYGLPKKDGFTDQLETSLKAEGRKVTVVNAGISGDTTAGGLARIDWALASKPDVVLLELGANDSLRGINPEVTRRNLKGILERLKLKKIPVLLAGMLSPTNMGREYGREFKSVYIDLSKKFDVVFYPFFLEGVAGSVKFNQADGMHPNKLGVAIITRNIMPSIHALLQRINQE